MKKKPFKKKTRSNDSKKQQVPKDVPTLQLKREKDIAMDFATKAYRKFDKLIKSVVLFGSTAKQTTVIGSDIDIVILLDDVSVSWDQELIAWYREELEKMIKANPYRQNLHINTVKLSTWWEDILRGDPVVLNVLRYGEAMIDMAGFFNPLKELLLQGKIRATPEAVYSALQRAPLHIERSKLSALNSVEGLYWAMVDSSQAALIAANVPPVSPEHVAVDLKTTFVDTGKLKMKYVIWYRDLLMLHKKIAHGEIRELRGIEIDGWQDRTQEFLDVMAQLVKDLIE